MKVTIASGTMLAFPLALFLTASGVAGDTPPDKAAPTSEQQALFDRIKVQEAWEVTKGDPEVLVGVIDNGFDFFHPNLKGQLIPGFYYPGGYHTESYEVIAHGTSIASIIVAKGGLAKMVGLAPRCKALTASTGVIEHHIYKFQKKFFEGHPDASLADLQKEMAKRQDELVKWAREWSDYQYGNAADAIRYLVDHKAKVINISGFLPRKACQSPAAWRKLEEAFAYAAKKSVVIVLAAGNNAAEVGDYPGSPETVIVAGATLLDDTRWEEKKEVEVFKVKVKQGSNFGKRLTVMAPVEKIMVCQPHERRMYEAGDGPLGPMKVPFKGEQELLAKGATSSAAPVVTSLVALVYCVRPELDAKTVVEIVKKGCDDIGEKGYDIYTGHGRVNFGKTIKLARDWGK